MKRYIVLLLVLGATSEAVGQQIYLRRTHPEIHIVRVNADGTGLTTILTLADVRAAVVAAIPEANDVSNTGQILELFVDSVRRKLYWTSKYEQTGEGDLPVLLRSELDGTSIEVVFNPGNAGSSNNEGFGSPQVLQDALSVPAVSTWGLAVMVLLLGVAATAMIKRRVA